jgi:tetratricopeptide (TPR) repeat protein
MRNKNLSARFVISAVCLLCLCACAKNPDAETQAAASSKQGDQSFAAKDYDKAVKDYSAALAAKPESQTYEKRAKAYAAKGEHEEAIKDYYQVLDSDQDSPATWTGLGISSTQTKEFSVAESAFQKALRLDPKYAEAYYYRALMFKAKDEPDNAKVDLKKFIEMSSDAKLKESAQAMLNELGAK